MNIVILLASGKSTRAGVNKLWAEVHGQPLWTVSHRTFLEHPEIDRLILVVPKGEELRFLPFVDSEKTLIVTGGETRMQSFKKGLESAGELHNDVLVIDHNSANPFVTAEEISAVIANAKEHGAAAVAHPVVDTVAEVDGTALIAIKERSNVRLMQTPQAVRGDVLNKIELKESTDLSSALLSHTPIKILPAHPLNKKITFAEDIELLRAHHSGPAKTFLGEDSHRFSNEGQLTLGGLTVSDCPAMEANSDGDVILHAIGRALAQATGQNFSELADPLMLGGDFDSRDYLAPLLEKCTVHDVSISIEGARPRIDPLLSELKTSLAKILAIDVNAIHLSAHTGEDLTPFGRGEGLRCLALVNVLQR